jgi:hypothetical protein
MIKRMFGKKAVSDIVATVIIILIVIAGIAVVWAVFVPLINSKMSTSGGDCVDASGKIMIHEGLTCNSSNTEIKLGVLRTSGNFELGAITALIYNSTGDMCSKEPSDSGLADKIKGLTANTQKVFTINLGLECNNPKRVSFIPKVKVRSGLQACNPVKDFLLVSCP